MRTFLIILLFSVSAQADFNSWKKTIAKKASKRGLKQEFVLKTLKDISFNPEIIKKDRNQVILDPDRDYEKFINKWLKDSPSRIELGKQKLKEHAKLLAQVESRYGVDKEVIVALWGTETLYGEITGDYDIVESLASLSYDGRRKKFFETQLFAVLRILQQGHVSRDKLKGSWAGATGHCQFMPSNIPLYAQDFNGDGKKDIWGSLPDIFASIANYLKKNGWKKGKSIGLLAKSPRKITMNPARYRTKSQYNRLGFRKLDGSKISGSWRARRAAKIPLSNSPIVLRGSNYIPLLKWNRSSLFAAFNIILVEGFKQ